MTTTLYMTPTSPPCRAVLMTLYSLNLEFEKRVLNMMNKEQCEDWYLLLNPRHCVPTLDDKGFVLWEGRSIMRYLVDKYGSNDILYPRDVQQRALVDRILDFDLGHLYRAVRDFARPQIFELAEENEALKEAVSRELAFLEAILEKQDGDWLVGDNMTIADFSVISSVSLLEAVDFDFTSYVNISKWQQTMKSIKVYKNASESFEKWKEMIKSPKWREMMQARHKQ